jgi:chaperonin GroEL
MPKKQLLFDDEVRKGLRTGIEKLAKAVKTTLGPKGGNVIIGECDTHRLSTITKDGVSVAREVYLEDPVENIGAQLVKEVALRSMNVAGDGTTTATVLAEAIYVLGMRYISNGADAALVKKGIDAAVEGIIEELKQLSVVVDTDEQIRQVATISANGASDIGDTITEAMKTVGRGGTVSVQASRGTKDVLTVVEGMETENGLLSPYFVTDMDKMEAVYEDVLILTVNHKMDDVNEMIPILQQVAKDGRPLLIMAESVEGEALATLINNRMKGVIKVVATKAPGFGDSRIQRLEDIAILTGATVVAESHGKRLEDLTLDDLGEAGRVVCGLHSTLIVDGKGDKQAIKSRVKLIEDEIASTPSDYTRQSLSVRKAKLAGGVGVIKVGGTTETEMRERVDRMEDALCATKAAVEEGIVPGGGLALIRAWQTFYAKRDLSGTDMDYGITIIGKAIEAPLRTIAENAGKEGAIIAETVKSSDLLSGYDARNDKVCNMIDAGIIDPTKVTRSALENAASISGLLLTTKCMLVDIPEPKEAPIMMQQPAYPGM